MDQVSHKLIICFLPWVSGALVQWLGIPEKVTGNRLVGVAWEGWVDSELHFFSHQCLNLSPLFLFFSLLLKWDLSPVRDNNILTENSEHGRQSHLHCLHSMCNRDYPRRKQKNYATETAAASKQEKRDRWNRRLPAEPEWVKNNCYSPTLPPS